MRPGPVVCLVSGPSGSGKTTLVESLLPALARRGIVAATVKHHRHRVDVDRTGKDTWRHRRAGARATFFVTEDEVVGFWDRPEGLDPEDLAGMCPPEVGLLLVEGFKELRGRLRIEVVRKGVERELPCSEEVLCIVTDIDGFAAPYPVLSLDDGDGVADLLARRLRSEGT